MRESGTLLNTDGKSPLLLLMSGKLLKKKQLFNAVSMEEFKRISNVEVTHIAWNILQTVHEGIKAVKINKLQQLTSKFESIRMSDDESFDEFYAKLNDIVNSTYNLGEIYD